MTSGRVRSRQVLERACSAAGPEFGDVRHSLGVLFEFLDTFPSFAAAVDTFDTLNPLIQLRTIIY